MTALSETQRRMFDALTGHADNASAVRLLRRSHAPSSARRLQIYRNNLLQSLTDALAAVFPVLARLVGEAYFRQLARALMAAHPPRSGNLHGFGRELPALVAERPSAAELAYLADVAALEWAWHEVYHEAGCAPLRPEQLGEVPIEQQLDLGLQLVPACRLVASPFPVLRIWQAHQREVDNEFNISLDEGGVRLLVLRRALEIEFVLLAHAEDHWLRALGSGATLADATLAALACDPAFDLAATLGRHLALGSFAALSFAALSLSSAETHAQQVSP